MSYNLFVRYHDITSCFNLRQTIYFIIAILLPAASGCHHLYNFSDKQHLQQVITSGISDRSERFAAIDIALAKYPQEATEWLGVGLLNTPDRDVADILIEKLSGMPTDSSVIYLSRYAGKFSDRHEQIVSICQNISREKYPNYLLRLLNSEKYREYQTDIFEQIDLWYYLCQYGSKTEIAKWLTSIAPNNPMIEDLCYYNSYLDYIPTEKGELLLARQLLNSIKNNSALLERISTLQKKGYEFSVADYGLLSSLSEDYLVNTSEKLVAEIQGYMVKTRHISRQPTYRLAANDTPDDFNSQKELFNIVEQIRIKLLCQAIFNSDNFAPTLHNKNTQSEVGGLCFWQDNKLVLTEYRPGMELGSHRYIESTELLSDAGRAITRWHVHDQLGSGKDIAGPGQDDMNYARQMRTNILIITAIEKTSDNKILFNFDLLTDKGKIIDLGCVTK